MRPGKLLILGLAFLISLVGALLYRWLPAREDVTTLPADSHVECLNFSPNGKTLATGHLDGTVVLWDAPHWRPKAALRGHNSQLRSVAFSPDGKTLASGGFDDPGVVILWDVAAAKEKARLRDHRSWIFSLAFSPDGKTLAAAGGGPAGDVNAAEISLWDLGSWRLRVSLKQFESRVTAFAFSPDGKTFVTKSQLDPVVEWDAATGQKLRTIKDVSLGCDVLAFSPDGLTLAVGEWKVLLLLLDSSNGRTRATISVQEFDGTRSVAFSPDGKFLAVAVGRARVNQTLFSGKGDLKLYEVATGKELASRRYSKDISCVTFSPDGRTLVTGGGVPGIGEIKVWRVSDLLPPSKVDAKSGPHPP